MTDKVDNPALLIRRALAHEATRVLEIVRAAYSKWIPAVGREPTPMAADYHKAIHEHDVDLATVGEDIVGLVETWQRADHLWIENIAVDPCRQGKGIGRALLVQVENKATQAGLAAIRLQTNEAFAANIKLYEKFGYHIDRRKPFKGGTTVFMSKKL